MRKTSFYYSFLALPKRKRDAIVAVWDFCRAVDDSVDLEPDPAAGKAGLDEWRREVARVFDGEAPATPQGRALQPFVGPCHLPRVEFESLVDGVEMDLLPKRFETFAALEPYCHRVASSVGLICAEIFEYRDPAVRDYARDLGVALQLTNILRDVGVDYRNGRLYLPLDDLARAGVGEEDVLHELERAAAGVQSHGLRLALEGHADRARLYFSRAVAALPAEERAAVLPAEIMRAIYTDLLRRVERSQFDVFRRVIRVPRGAQARIALRTWGVIRFGRAAHG